MKIVVFGLTISSSWGNGHATLWRALCKHLVRLGHRVAFYEHDVPYYAATRDLFETIAAGGEAAWSVEVQIMPVAEAANYRFDVFDLKVDRTRRAPIRFDAAATPELPNAPDPWGAGGG